MYRIDNATAVPHASGVPTPAAPGPNVGGYFTKGSPGVTAATVVDDDWANALQEEIAAVIEGAGITLSKTLRNQLLAAIPIVATGRLIGVQKWTAGSTVTYTPTAGMKSVLALGGGAGGGAGGVQGHGAGVAGNTGGGGSGSVAYVSLTAAQIGASQTVTIGTGGDGGAPGNNVGSNGSTTSLGSLFSCPGGSGSPGEPTSVSSGNAAVYAPGNGGAAPTISTGTRIWSSPGEQGHSGILLYVGGLLFSQSGKGGKSPGIGGAPGGSIGAISGGNAGTLGSGGGGASSADAAGGTGQTGGAGGDGFMIIWEFA